MELERRLQQSPQARRLRQAGQLQEDLVHIVADCFVAGEQAVVGVAARRTGMVVAGAEVAVAAYALRFAAHDQHQLGVRLVADHAVHDVRAGFLQPRRQLDVGLFIEARAQLDDHRDVLAGLRRRHQRVDDVRLIAGAVQRLLDRQHARVGGRLAQQVHDRREALERMVQQHVALPDGVEQVVRVAEALGQPGREYRILEIRPRHQVVDGREAVEVDRPGHRIAVLRAEREMLQQEVDHCRRAVRRGLEPHRRAVAALREFALERAAQVVDFFVVDVQVAVARQAELIAAQHLHPAEQPGDEGFDDGRQRHQPLAAVGGGQRHDARQRARRLHHGHVAIAPEGVLAGQSDDEIEALVLDARERARRIEAQRAQHRLHLLHEAALEPGVRVGVPVGASEQFDALGVQRAEQHVVEHAVLIVDQRARARVNRCQLLGDAERVGRGLRGTELQQLLEPGDPDLEELVEVRGADAQEPQPLEQRHARVLRLGQHPGVELQRRQLAVDEVLGSVQRQLIQGRAPGAEAFKGTIVRSERVTTVLQGSANRKFRGFGTHFAGATEPRAPPSC